jgi:hypothetical protein
MSDFGWKLIGSYSVPVYRCGLRAGQQVALRHELVVFDRRGKPTGRLHPAGEVFTVLHGSEDDPGVVWLRQADGEYCTWDDEVEVFDWFEVIDRADGQSPERPS